MNIDKESGLMTKSFKTEGELNGDVLTQKYDCCAILTTNKGQMVVSICPKTMQFKGKNDTLWYNI